jgi:hypothetical protein
MNGYENISLGQTDDPLAELEASAHDAQSTEVIANNVLEYLPLTDISKFLDCVVSKLRHGGTLILTGVDAYTVAQDYVAFKLTIEDFNLLLHGHGDFVKKGTLALHGLVNYIKQEFGLKVISKTLEEYNYVIEVQRP